MKALLPWLAAGLVLPAQAAVLTVTTTAPTGDGSLQQAIIDSNASPGVQDTIQFKLPDPGIQTIRLSANLLPDITDPVIIDGTSQPGYNGTPLIFLDGASAKNVAGLAITAGNSTIRGLAIGRVGRSGSPGGYGILLQDGGSNRIEACLLGIDPTGAKSGFNRIGGILISNSVANVVGGPGAAQRNILSGNGAAGVLIDGPGASNNIVIGNFIGLAADGSSPAGNSDGVLIADGAASNRIGGPDPGERNVIAGNLDNNINLQSGATGNHIEGNLIGGFRADGGVLALANPGDANDFGIRIMDSPANFIGGTLPGVGNVISGNNQDGIVIRGTSGGNVIQGNRIGTDAAGAAAVPNGTGILVSGVNGIVVGGSGAGAGNVISANSNDGVFLLDASETIIQGNRIGTDATGKMALGNGHTNSFGGGGSGVSLSTINKQLVGNLIGGTDPLAGNLISGNLWIGLAISGTQAISNVIQGNFIGVDVTGTNALGNLQDGIDIYGAFGTVIGGDEEGSGNVISANGGVGIMLGGFFGLASSNTVVAGNSIGLSAPVARAATAASAQRGNARPADFVDDVRVLLSNVSNGIFLAYSDRVVAGGRYRGGMLKRHRNRQHQKSGPHIGVATGTLALIEGIFIDTTLAQVYGASASAPPAPHLDKVGRVPSPAGGITITGGISGLAPGTMVSVQFYGDGPIDAGLRLRAPLAETPDLSTWNGTADANGNAAFSCTVFDFTRGAGNGIDAVTALAIVADDTSPFAMNVTVPPLGGPPSNFILTVPFAEVDEGGNYVFTVSRTITGQPATLGYSTYTPVILSPPGPGPGMAQPGLDYTPSFGTLIFNSGETTKSFSVQTKARPDFDGTRLLGVAVYDRSAMFDTAAKLYSVLAINDQDTAPGSPVGLTAKHGVGGVDYSWLNGGYLQLSHSLTGPYVTSVGAASPFHVGTTVDTGFAKVVGDTALRAWNIRLLNGTGVADAGRVIGAGDRGKATATDATGESHFDAVPAGDVVFNIYDFTLVDHETTDTQSIEAVKLGFQVAAGSQSVGPLKQEFSPREEPSDTDCECSPWCAIVGGLIDGVLRVEASGGASGAFCDETPVVTITSPAGPAPAGQLSFFPAPAGEWSVTTTVCGKSKTCRITVP